MTVTETSRRGVWWLALCSVVAFGFTSGLLESQQSFLRGVWFFQMLYGLGFVGYFWLVWSRTMTRDRDHRYEAVVVISAGIALRLLIFSGPSSDDLQRYVWEGRIQQERWNPYAVAPTDERLAHLRDDHWSSIPHPKMTAGCSPLSEMLFAAVAWVYPSGGAIKLALVAWDIVALLALAGWLRASGKSASWVVVYALSPLVLTAFSMEGHADSMMLGWMALGGWASMRRRWYACGLCIGLAILSKAMAIVLLAWLLRRNPRAALVALVVILAGYLPYSAAGPGLIASLVHAGLGPFFNALVPSCLQLFLADWSTIAICIVLVVAYTLWLATCQQLEMHQFGVRVFGLMLIMLPVVHFWYVSWVLLFGAHRIRWRWIVLSGSMVFYFDTWMALAQTETWYLPTVSYVLIWVPFVLAWMVEEAGRYWSMNRARQEAMMRAEEFGRLP